MGVYVYCTKPSAVATAVVEVGGYQSTEKVALYRYAYKPSWSWDAEKWNAQMRFRSGATACAAAWNRVDAPRVPMFGVMVGDDKIAPAAGCEAFLTKGSPEVYDDLVERGGRIVRWLQLPKGFAVAGSVAAERRA